MEALQKTFDWRGEQILAVATGVTWYIYRGDDVLGGPQVKAGEEWSATAQRLQSWMDKHYGRLTI